MPANTPRYGLPYPLLTDAADILGAVEPLALALDALPSRGKAIIATTESRTNTAYGTLTTPEQVAGIVLPTDGLLVVAYQATWQESVAAAGRVAIFIGTNQLKGATATGAAVVNEVSIGSPANTDVPLASQPFGLVSAIPGAASSDVSTGQIVGMSSGISEPHPAGPCHIFAAAGTYTVSVQFRATSGSVTVKNRKLWVWTIAF
jgi:hypothetical protein